MMKSSKTEQRNCGLKDNALEDSPNNKMWKVTATVIFSTGNTRTKYKQVTCLHILLLFISLYHVSHRKASETILIDQYR
uniref:Uncharacterized protein n=2 Tax=Arion vulgaris TaxID=1028688 RepID=A0A0B6Y064_9EUPU